MRRNSMPVSSGYSDGRTPRCENTQYRRDSGRTFTYIYERPENLFEYGRQGSARHAFRKSGVRVGRLNLTLKRK